MVCPSFWIRRLRHHKRSGQLSYSQSGRVASHKRSVLLSGFVVFVLGSVISREVWPFAGIHRFERWSKPRTKGLAICRQEGGGRAREKRSVLLSRFVVFVAGSVRSPEVSQEVWPFVDWPDCRPILAVPVRTLAKWSVPLSGSIVVNEGLVI